MNIQNLLLRHVVVLTLVILLSCGCNASRTDDQVYSKCMQEIQDYKDNLAKLNLAENKDSKSGRIVITGGSDMFSLESLRNQAYQYRKIHPNVEIVFDVETDYEKIGKVTSLQFMTGNLGDIVISYGGQRVPPRNGKLENLKTYFERDESIDTKKYFMKAMTNVKNGAFYSIHTDVYRENLFAIREDAPAHIKARFLNSENLSFNDLVEMYTEYTEQNSSNSKLQFCNFMSPFQPFYYNIEKLVDRENMKVDIANSEFTKKFVNYTNIIPRNFVEYDQGGVIFKPQSFSKSMLESLHDINTNFLFYRIVSSVESAMLPIENRVYTMPRVVTTSSGNSLYSEKLRIGISSTSKHKSLAWDFIKYIIADKDLNLGDGTGQHRKYLAQVGENPLNKNNLKSLTAISVGEILGGLSNKTIQINSRNIIIDADEYKDSVKNFALESMEALNLSTSEFTEFYSADDRSIIWDDLYLYFTGKRDIKSALKIIENKIRIYIGE